MNMSLDIAWKSLNKKKEELCGDTVENKNRGFGYIVAV